MRALQGCERLVHSAVEEPAERQLQARLGVVLAVAPFVATAAFAPALAQSSSPTLVLAAICAVFGTFWSSAVLLVASGSSLGAGALALAGAAATAAAGLALADGGGASPTAALLLALVLEPALIWRRRRAALTGLAAALAALAVAEASARVFAAAASAPSAWQWLLPLGYAATVAARLTGLAAGATAGETRASASLERTIEAVVLRLSPHGEVLDASERSYELFGLAPPLVTGNAFFERVHIADRVAYLSALADLRAGAGTRSLELKLRLPGIPGSDSGPLFRPFSVELGAAENSEDGFVAVVRSAAELAALRAVRDEAVQALDGVETGKRRFLATVGHELRTPLNAIIGFSDMLDHGICGNLADPRQKDYVGLIRDAGQHLLAVVDAILDISRLEAGTYPIAAEPFRFAEAASACHAMLSLQAAEKRLRFALELGHDLGEITADRRAVNQMLINLAGNAIKFTPAGGAVTIGARRVGSRLHVKVTDTGIGIGAADLGRLGQPFVQVHNDAGHAREGTGLGLSLVKGLVALHDGTMAIDSAPGEGTTVTLSLPVAGPADGPSPAAPAPPRRELVTLKARPHGPLRKTA